MIENKRIAIVQGGPFVGNLYLDGSWASSEDVYAFIGVKGRRFNWLSRFLGLSYLWFDDIVSARKDANRGL